MLRERLAWAGIFAFLFGCAASFTSIPAAKELRPITIAAALALDAPPRSAVRVRDIARAERVLGVEATPEPIAEVSAAPPMPAPTPEPTPRPTPAPLIATLPSLPDPPTAGIVVASWYGPGFYGNRTACGQTYTPELIGVAHRTLPCGTLVVIEYRGRVLTVPVIDRGPYIAGRTLDLSNATRLAIGCPDLCTLSMRIGP